MTPEALPLFTVCGVYVPPGQTPIEDWNNGTYTFEALDQDAAIEKTCETATSELPNDLKSGFAVAFAVACVHPGTTLKVDANLNWVDLAVDPTEEQRLHPEPSAYTICGIALPEWRTVHYFVGAAYGPRMAYGTVYEELEAQGRKFLFAAAHEGNVARLPRPDGTDYLYAIPDARTPADLRMRMERDWAPGSPVIREMLGLTS